MIEPDKKCFLCGKEGALALFGVLFGAVIIAMSVNVVYMLRKESVAATVEQVSIDD